MNYWASSAVDMGSSYGLPNLAQVSFFNSGGRNASALILMTEAWTKNGPSAGGGWYASSTVGAQGAKPGPRFLGIPGYTTGASRYSNYDTEITYARHRKSKDYGSPLKARGRINIGFADGHVELLSHDDLADVGTGLSRLKALWSHKDISLNN